MIWNGMIERRTRGVYHCHCLCHCLYLFFFIFVFILVPFVTKDHNCAFALFIFAVGALFGFTLLCRLAPVLACLGVALEVEVYLALEDDEGKGAGLIVAQVGLGTLCLGGGNAVTMIVRRY